MAYVGAPVLEAVGLGLGLGLGLGCVAYVGAPVLEAVASEALQDVEPLAGRYVPVAPLLMRVRVRVRVRGWEGLELG